MLEKAPVARFFRVVPLACAGLSVIIGMLTLVGWVSAIPILASVRANYIPMAPSTAFCFSLVAAGLILHLTRPRLVWLTRTLAGLVLLMAAAKFVEFVGGFQFGIDAWFVKDPALFGAVRTGRMAPLTATDFVFLAGGLLLLTVVANPTRACIAGAITSLIGAVILVGYLYGTPLLYGGTVIPVALSTAVGFFLCGTGLTVAAGPEAWPLRAFLGSSTQAVLLRAFVPLIIAASLVNGWIIAVLVGQMRGNPAVVSAMCTLAFATLVTWIVTRISRNVGGRIDRAEKDREVAQASLVLLNSELETRVIDRTRELSRKNDQMLDELRMARELQTALLPRQFPTVPPNVSDRESALRFLSLYFPTGDVSGDFYNVFPIGEKAVGALICDVMGHGVRSALITSMIRGLVEEHSTAAMDPGELLTRINNALTLIFKQAETTMFATCFYVVADLERAEFRFANAGHPCALHMRPGNGGAERLECDGRRGPAMGLIPGASYGTTVKSMEEGDLVMLFTDGLFEVESAEGEQFSEERLQTAASTYATLAPEKFFSGVLGDIRGFSQSDSFEDDVCVVGVKIQHMN